MHVAHHDRVAFLHRAKNDPARNGDARPLPFPVIDAWHPWTVRSLQTV
jgi:hypothetical protein